ALPGWYALIGPAKMDAAITQKVSAAVNQFLTDPQIAQKLNDQFLFPIPGTPVDIQKRAESEARIWGGLIDDLKLQID
ncbi:MAG: tripartite tricarboxylate transporter substrate binding protein, partial [Betaproteobacteria bacterium]